MGKRSNLIKATYHLVFFPETHKYIEMETLLDWPKLIELTEEKAFTEPGKDKITQLLHLHFWAKNVQEASLFQAETLEAFYLIEKNALWDPLQGLQNPFPMLERLKQGSVLEVAELALLRKWIDAIDAWGTIPREELKGEKIKKAIAQLPNLQSTLKLLNLILTPEGELSEKASSKLSSLYSEIRSLKKEIQSTLETILKKLQTQGIAQDRFIDLRDGRYVIPVKIGSQSEILGITHETSVSKQTAYVEPKESEALNHRLKQKQGELLQEIFIILSETSKKLSPHSDLFYSSIQILTHWDYVQAKARFGKNYGGKPIQVVEEKTFKIRHGAHPLLWSSLPVESIIRNDIDLEPPTQTLLITGPNTGGKTVLLKMLGIAGICARTGFLLPASEQSIVPFFKNFFTDLGDSQSIEQHLSSFAGHLMTYKKILENISESSLVLIDELNTATDPEEGTALARALIEKIMEKNALIITTTHDPYLKSLAYNDSRILNASMTFDEKSEKPTYKIAIGIPGSSRALETAQRLGLPQDVLLLAKKYLSNKHSEFEKTISMLESHAKGAELAFHEAKKLKAEAETLKNDWIEKTKKSTQELLDKTKQKLKRVLEEANDQVREAVKMMNETRTRKGIDKTRDLMQAAQSKSFIDIDKTLQEEAPEIAQLLEKNISESLEPEKTLQTGMSVRIPKWKSIGILDEIKGNQARVYIGNIAMTIPLTDLEPVHTSQQLQPKDKVKIIDFSEGTHERTRLDLRGIRYEDAMSELEQFLDHAFRDKSIQEVTIIHGLGTGALREGTRKTLKKLPYIKNFRDGGAGQGGTGSTIILFDRD